MGTVSNIVISGPPRIYIAVASTDPPANSVAYGTAWGGAWTDLGFTEEDSDVEYSHAFENTKHKVDQYTSAVKATRASDEATVKFTLAEQTLANMQRAIGGIGTLTAGSTESTLKVGANTVTLTEYAIGVEGYGPGTDDDDVRYRRYVFNKCVLDDAGAQALKRNEKTPLELTYGCLADTSKAAGQELYQIVDRQVD